MGIDKLIPFLKEKCPDSVLKLPITFFSGERIAVDGHAILHKIYSNAKRDIINRSGIEVDEERFLHESLERITDFVLDHIKYDISLVFVWDGKISEYKEQEVAGRIEKSKENKRKLDEKIEYINSLNPLKRTSEDIAELKQLQKNYSHIKYEHKEYIKKFISEMGFPSFTAENDGEKLCAELAMQNLVTAVISNDTDVLALGTKIFIHDRVGYILDEKTNTKVPGVECIFLDAILEELNITYETFVDMCILAGCDFNSNGAKKGIPGISIGKSYKFLVTEGCNTIENVMKKYPQHPYELLKTDICRERFTCRKRLIDERDLQINLDFETYIDLFQINENKKKLLKKHIFNLIC